MTKPSYRQGCPAGSQVRGGAPDASNPDDYAWVVDFNYGNSNINNRDNRNYVRPVRASEYQSANDSDVTLRDFYLAWQRARRFKKPSANQLQFEANWIDGLLDLQARIASGSWKPAPTVCFIAEQPKAREIHAPDFADRIVHHWLVPKLEAIFETQFIEHSFANREGKGTHAAVEQLKRFVRQVQYGQGCGWYLQLDIHNFFNSIHRPTLYRLIKAAMERHDVPLPVRQVTHALLSKSPLHAGVIHRASLSERLQVPAHKRLENAAPGCGLPIGNLSSQFFANVFLHQLDLFAKHALKAKRYLRYVDDFVLIHESRQQLEQWQSEIESFLQTKLRLSLKADIKLLPLTSGIDFLGYVVYPTHTRVRRRVVSHAREKLARFETTNVRDGKLMASAEQRREIRDVWASYAGHMRHANSRRLLQQITARFPWLQEVA